MLADISHMACGPTSTDPMLADIMLSDTMLNDTSCFIILSGTFGIYYIFGTKLIYPGV